MLHVYIRKGTMQLEEKDAKFHFDTFYYPGNTHAFGDILLLVNRPEPSDKQIYKSLLGIILILHKKVHVIRLKGIDSSGSHFVIHTMHVLLHNAHWQL